MGRFEPIYTPAQREAIAHAVLDGLEGVKLTARQAAEKLNAGALGVPAPPQPMPLSTAQDIAKRARRGRRVAASTLAAQADPRHALAELFVEGVAVARLELERIKTNSEHKRLKLVDFERWAAVLERLAKAGTQLAARPPGPMKPTGNGAGKAPGKDEAPEAGGDLERLVAAHERASESR